MTLPTPYFDRNGCTLYVGDALTTLRELPAASAQMCVTSPPYYQLRDYGVPGQIGMEGTPDAYIAALVAVFREVRRVLRPDGVCWLNIGDAFANDAKWGGSTGGKHAAGLHGDTGIGRRKLTTGVPPKNLLLIPFRLVLALQADGWIVRQTIIWYKRNCMPESVTDRPTTSHEYIFLLAKGGAYFYDADAIREAQSQGTLERFAPGKAPRRPSPKYSAADGFVKPDEVSGPVSILPNGRNARSVWAISPTPFTTAHLDVGGVEHFAAYPPELARRCIRAGTSERGCCPACGAPWERVTGRHAAPKSVERLRNVGGRTDGYTRPRASGGLPPVTNETTGWRATCACPAAPPVPCTVLDPFAGSGTTLLAAQQLGRRAVGIELNPDYARIVEARVGRQGLLDFAAEPEASA